MNVQLIDLDSRIENLALMRLSTFHKEKGDCVTLSVLRGKLSGAPITNMVDRVYISTVFSWNRAKASLLCLKFRGRATVGGTGISPDSRLPDDVAQCPVDYELYGGKRAIGFISTGCPNKCPWCIVWRKEGDIQRVSTAKEIVGNQSEAIFLDNNFLALPGHALDLEWLAENDTVIDFNQGLDAAFVTPENAGLISSCRFKYSPGIRLALDSDERIGVVKAALNTLAGAGIAPSRVMVYVLIGFHGFKSDIKRLMTCRAWGVSAFPMGYRALHTGNEPMRGWNPGLYKKYKRLIIRLPHARSVWEGFEREVVPLLDNQQAP